MTQIVSVVGYEGRTYDLSFLVNLSCGHHKRVDHYFAARNPPGSPTGCEKCLDDVLPVENVPVDKFVSPEPTLLDSPEAEVAAILIEECAEVIQRTTKLLRFGIHEVQKDQPHDNAFRCGQEVGDLLETIQLALKYGIVTQGGIDEGRKNKRRQLEKYLQKARA